MTAGSSPRDEVAEPFPHSGLGALIIAAASDAADAILLADDEGAVTARDVARQVQLTAAHFRAAGIGPGERILIVAGAQVGAIVALTAALRIGAEPALAPCGIGPVEIAAHAKAAEAVALVGPARYGRLELGETYLSAASIVDTVRLVATQGPEPVDGAIDLSARALAAISGTPPSDDAGSETPVIATFQGKTLAPTMIVSRQAALFADALSLCEQARINPSKRIVSTLPPATLAGLVAGPFAALVGASSLTFHGPFDSERFLTAWDAQAGSHLVAPCAMGAAFEDAALAAEATSLILVSRYADMHSFALPSPLACERPIVDLYAFGEDTLLVRRRTDGEARPPARITDKSKGGGLGARLNRARADLDVRGNERS